MALSGDFMMRKRYGILIFVIVVLGIKLCIFLVSKEMSILTAGVDISRGHARSTPKRQHQYVLPRPDCSQKLLVYECTSDTRDCGGLGQRQRGMVSVFLLALLTNRTFVIIHTSPCSLSEFFEPNVYNWSQCVSAVESADDKLYIDGMKARWTLPEMSKMEKGDIWEERVVVIITNVMLNAKIRSHPGAFETIPWIFDGPREYTTHIVFHALFNLTKPFEDHVNRVLRHFTMNGTKQLVGIHIRTQLIHRKFVLTVFESLEPFSPSSKYVVYVASDDDSVREYAAAHIPNYVTLNVSNVTLALNTEDADCNSLYYAMLEQQIIARSTIILKTGSEFSKLAYMIRGKRAGIYEFRFKRIRITDRLLEFPNTEYSFVT